MAKSSTMKTCAWEHCRHEKMVDTERQKYCISRKPYRTYYYHEDCYAEKCDLELIRDLWFKHVNPTVPIKSLYVAVRKLMDRPGVTTKYLVFALQYAITHHMKINHPNGLVYIIDKNEVKDAYRKATTPIVKQSEFVAKQQDDDSAPMVAINRKKPVSFSSVLGGDRR